MKKQLIIAAICIFFLLGLFLPHASSTNDPLEVLSVERTVHITYHKIFQVTDQYIYINTGEDPLTSLIIEVPYQFSDKIASFNVFGADSQKLSYQELPYDGSNFLKWRIYLDSPLLGGDTVKVQNNLTFFGISSDYGDTLVDGTNGHINFNFVRYPSSPYPIQNCSVTFTCDPRVTIYNPSDSRYYSILPLVLEVSVTKNNITSFNSRYNLSTTPPTSQSYALSAVKFPYIKREINIDLWGYMYISEEHYIENNGPYGNFRITTWQLKVPEDAENVFVYDKFGQLAFRRFEENPENISINFDSTRYTLQRGENTIYWITYRLPLYTRGYSSSDLLKLDFDILFGKIDGLVENYEIKIILPKDSSLNYILPDVDSVNTIDNSLIILFNETNITPFNSKQIELEVNFIQSYLQFLSRPLIFLIILGAVCASYVITKRIIPSEERLFERTTVVPTPILLEFCSLFEEKVSMVAEIEKLDEDLKRKRIKKRIYRNQRKTSERKILELDKDIDDLKIHLKNAGGRFAQIVNELEINEAERESAKDGLFNLEQRYLRKKISVVAYQKLSKDLVNRHKKSKTKIDKLIFELREILT